MVVTDNDENESQRLPLDRRSGAGVRMSRNSYLGAQPQSSLRVLVVLNNHNLHYLRLCALQGVQGTVHTTASCTKQPQSSLPSAPLCARIQANLL